MKIYVHIYTINTLLLLGWLLFGSLVVKAQTGYTLVGSARPGAIADYYDVTQERPGLTQTGAVWCNQLLKLNESFEFEFTVNFSGNPNGSDGITVVMQTEGITALGTGGAGMGFQGIQPSFGIEFDTHYNSVKGDPGGPAIDHIALVRDGNNDHRLNPSLAGPVPISTTSRNIKDGRDHLVKVIWNATTHLLEVSIDCAPKVSQSIDLINDVFGGVQEVFWGITSATVLAGNAHTVYLPKDIIVRDTLQACPMESVTLVAGLSIDNKYDWKPTTGLSDPGIRNPQLVVTTSQLYTVSYVDRCSVAKTDNVYVNAKVPNVSLGGDREVCENETVTLTPVLTPSSPNAAFRWSTGETTPQLVPQFSGLYIVQVTVGGCTTSDSSKVTFHPLPEPGFLNAPTYDCSPGTPIVLDPQVKGTDLLFTWTPGGTNEPVLSASAPGRYTAKISTPFGCSIEQSFTILDNCPPDALIFVPDAFSPNGDGTNELFEWKSNTSVEARMKIYNHWGEVIFSSANAGEFWNGVWKGQLCTSGVYAWRIDYRSQQSNESQWFVKRGAVLLLR